MKILAVDYGDSRTGLAVCDPTEFLASPVTPQIEERSMGKVADKVVAAAKAQNAQLIVLGLPRNMDGTEGSRAQKCRKLGTLLEEKSGLPVRMWDERQTTITAAGILSENGTFGKKRKAVLDSVSATVILENYLAWRKNHPGQQ
ncbi:MAG: Holliday junction resolvase RuvX [Faecalibacterium sp.]|nr:Holliday junction resolvase RuvX [Faecalibacterium sp.]